MYPCLIAWYNSKIEIESRLHCITISDDDCIQIIFIDIIIILIIIIIIIFISIIIIIIIIIIRILNHIPF